MAVTTDHSPFTVEEKERARTDIWRTPPGAPGVEELVLGMMDAALKGRLSIEKAVSLISTNGARRFGIYPHKGAIIMDADADLVIYDPAQTTTIHPDMLFSQARVSDKLYDGRTFQGRVRRLPGACSPDAGQWTHRLCRWGSGRSTRLGPIRPP